MTRKRQKIEENLFAERAAALLGEDWVIQEPVNEREWPDLLIETAEGFFGLEVRKIYADEVSKGSPKRAAESSRAKLLREVAALYYEGGGPPARVQFYGQPDDPANLAKDLASIVPSMQPWERKKVTYHNSKWMYVCRLPGGCATYSHWDIVSDLVGWVDVVDSSVVQRVIQEKSSKLPRYKTHLENVRLLLVCDRTRNSGKQLFSDPPNLDRAGFDQIYLLSFPDKLVQTPAK